MRLYIPEIGSRIRLTEDWTFSLYRERRNDALLKQYGVKGGWSSRDDAPITHTLKADTVLTVDRIYVKKGLEDFSSVTFLIVPPNRRAKGGRFWAKLSDVNQIRFELRPEDQPWWFGVADALRDGKDIDVTVPNVGFVHLTPRGSETISALMQKEILVCSEGGTSFLVKPENTYNDYYFWGKPLSTKTRRNRNDIRKYDTITGWGDPI